MIYFLLFIHILIFMGALLCKYLYPNVSLNSYFVGLSFGYIPSMFVLWLNR